MYCYVKQYFQVLVSWSLDAMQCIAIYSVASWEQQKNNNNQHNTDLFKGLAWSRAMTERLNNYSRLHRKYIEQNKEGVFEKNVGKLQFSLLSHCNFKFKLLSNVVNKRKNLHLRRGTQDYCIRNSLPLLLLLFLPSTIYFSLYFYV